MSKKICTYISASQIGTFLTCPIAYYNFYVKGMTRPSPNIYMVYGTAIHKALEFNFKQKIKSKKDLRHVEVIDKFLEIFKEEQKKVKEFVSPIVVRTMQLSAQESLSYYLNQIAPDIQPQEVEYKFEVKLKHFPIIIMGYMDLVTIDGVIRDYKTAGKDWKRKFSPSAVGKSMQMTLYAAAYRKLFKRKEKGLIFDVMPRCEYKVFVRETTRTDEEILSVLKLATTIEKITKLGVFIPNFNSCGSCYFKNKCLKQPIIDK